MSVRLVPKTKSVGQVQMSNGSWMDMLRWGVFMPGIGEREQITLHNLKETVDFLKVCKGFEMQ